MSLPGRRAPGVPRSSVPGAWGLSGGRDERGAQGPGMWLQAARLALGTASALGLARFSYGLLVPAMAGQLGWNLAQAGALNTANGLGYLVGAVITAPVARRLGEGATFRLGMVVTAAALASSAASGDYTFLLLSRAVAGVSGALVFVTGGVIAARLSARAASAAPLAIYFSGPGLGIAVSGAVIPAVLGADPGRWPLVWLGLAAAAALATAASWPAAVGGGTAASGLAGLGAIRRLWPVAAAYFLFGAGYIAYITFLSAYLTAQRAGTGQIAVTWTLLGLAAVAGPAAWRGPTARWRAARLLAAALACIGAAALAALASSVPAVVTGSAVLYGISFLLVPVAVTALIRAAVPPGAWTGVLAVFTILFSAGQMAGPVAAGALADRYGAGATLAWTAVACTAGAALAAVTRGAAGGAPHDADGVTADDPGV